MSDRGDRSETDEAMHEADVRNGEPDALEDGASGTDRSDDADAGPVDSDFDVTEPTESGEPVHHDVGGDIGEGAD